MVEKADPSPNEHDFIVTAVEPADADEVGTIAVTLTDARGGRVRLHLDTDMAELLRERVAAALDKRTGP